MGSSAERLSAARGSDSESCEYSPRGGQFRKIEDPTPAHPNLGIDDAERLAEVRALCPEMRFGQMLATVGLLGEDETGHTLWDVEDVEFAAALERFAADLKRRAATEPANVSKAS